MKPFITTISSISTLTELSGTQRSQTSRENGMRTVKWSTGSSIDVSISYVSHSLICSPPTITVISCDGVPREGVVMRWPRR